MTTDVVTDAKTGYILFIDGHTLWALATWLLMFLPAVLSLTMNYNNCLKSFTKILGHLPFGQVFYHFKVIWRLKQLREEMMEQIKFYSELDFDELPTDIKDQLKLRFLKYHKAKDEYKIIMSDLQTQKARPCSFLTHLNSNA